MIPPRAPTLLLLLPLLLQAQPALVLHPGSTRDWVKRTGGGRDSVRYHLAFLDGRVVEPQSGTEPVFPGTAVDWRVRITSPDTPSITDTAILRSHGGIVEVAKGALPPKDASFTGVVYWRKPSIHFPIDLRWNQADEITAARYAPKSPLFDSIHMPTGAWEVALLEDARTISIKYGSYGLTLFGPLDRGFSHSLPATVSRDSLGIVAWLAHGAFWELRGVDGAARAPYRGKLGHALRKGECWVYRDTNSTTFTGTAITGTVALELLEPPRDSGTAVVLSVRKTTSPDTGGRTSSTIAVIVDPAHHFVRAGTDSGTAWRLPSTPEGRWALGLISHLTDATSAEPSYHSRHSSTRGEIPSTTNASEDLIRFDSTSGARLIRSTNSNTIIRGGEPYGRTWSLVAHALDNIALDATTRLPQPARDLAWLRARIARDPSLEVVRIRLDGTRTSARGAAALKLLQERGVGVVLVRDGQKLASLRVARP